jgi:hypothetical protein
MLVLRVSLAEGRPRDGGITMRKFGLVLAALATFSMTVLPVTPSLAAGPADSTRAQHKILSLAQQGSLAVLTQAQWSALAASDPKLYDKLQTARANRVAPVLAPKERQKIRHLTMANIRSIKAGQTASTKLTVTPQAPDPAAALASCFTGLASGAAFGPIGQILAGIGCILIFIPLIPWNMISQLFSALFAPPAAAKP